MAGRILLFPVPISEGERLGIPSENISLLTSIDLFIAENPKTLRHHLKQMAPEISLRDFEYLQLGTAKRSGDDDQFLDRIATGSTGAIASEAGCPGIADPGGHLVTKAHDLGLRVEPLVGPSSIMLALMASGLNGQDFHFHGYVELDNKERMRTLRSMERSAKDQKTTHIFIETPYRSDKTMKDLMNMLAPDTRVCVAIDVMGPNERIITRTVMDWAISPIEIGKTPAVFLIG